MASQSPQLAHAFALSAAGREEEAMALIRELAAQGDPDALFTLADAHWRGGPVPQDFARGRELFERASNAGHAVAIRAFTNLLASGVVGPADGPRAIGRLRV